MAYKQRWLEYFEVLDADKSGFVDLGDLQYSNKVFSAMLGQPEDAPAVKAAVASCRNFFDCLIKDFDTNKDGKVSKEELLAGVERLFIGKQPSELPTWWKENIVSGFNQFDRNKNGELSPQELVAALRQVSPQTSEEDIIKSYEWVVKRSPTGKYDGPAYSDIVIYLWATSPDDIPEVTVSTPYLRKQN